MLATSALAFCDRLETLRTLSHARACACVYVWHNSLNTDEVNYGKLCAAETMVFSSCIPRLENIYDLQCTHSLFRVFRLSNRVAANGFFEWRPHAYECAKSDDQHSSENGRICVVCTAKENM